MALRGVAPDLGEHFLAGEGLAGVGHQHLEKVKFHPRELDPFAGLKHLAFVGQDHELANFDLPRAAASGRRARTAGRTTQDAANAGFQFLRAEGFGDVVVGAQLQAQDAVFDF